MTERLHSYINMELNRFLKIEKSEVVYIHKLPKAQKGKGNKAINDSVTMWQRGYIRLRLQKKCKAWRAGRYIFLKWVHINYHLNKSLILFKTN